MIAIWLMLFVLLQVALGIAVEGSLGELRNPVQGTRENQLRQRLKEEPGRPLVVALGSSQTLCALNVRQINEARASADLLVFNYALPGCGLYHQQTILEGLLARGIKPDGIIVEITAFALPVDPAIADLPLGAYTWSEVRAIARRRGTHAVYLDWFESRSIPWFTHRQAIMRCILPKWMPEELRIYVPWGRDTDPSGWYANPTPPDPKYIETSRQAWEAALQNYDIVNANRAALFEIVRICHERKIKIMFLLPPVGPAAMSWYGPRTEPMLQELLAQIRVRSGAPIIDARTWFESESPFVDTVHLTPEGSTQFTRRFASEAAAFFATASAR
jgi:hypothetical protein